MHVSIFTPSHKPDYLKEVWACLKEQTYTKWEWVVVANGDRTADVCLELNKLCADDSRVRVVYSRERTVGGLKNVACSECRGDLFLEYDHDDLITHDCLESVVAAAKKAPKACFIYSDDVTCDWQGNSHVFMSEFGWRQYNWAYKGMIYKINRQFPINVRTLADILFAPDHVRVWSRAAYQLVGGHNPKLRVGDDHELIVRTYLMGVHFHHIERPLYIHRLKADTTSQTSLPEIQRTSRATRDEFLHAMIKEWCRREKLPMYDLGGAHNCPHGYIPIDKRLPDPAHPQGICCEIMSDAVNEDALGLSGLRQYLRPNSVGCFRANDLLEYIPQERVPELLNMLYEMLVPGGWLLTATPAVCDDEGRAGRGAFQNPEYKSLWSSNSFWYYCKRQFAKHVPVIKCRFQTVRLFNHYPSDWHRMHLIPYVTWDACALKDDRYWPGPQEI